MTNLARWERYSPVSLGLEQMFNRLDTLTDSTVGNYPPYNIHKISENEFKIEVALAGYSKDDIELELKDSTLTVRNKQKEKIVNENKIDSQTNTIRDLNKKIQKDERVNFSLLPLSDGLSFIIKR